MKKFVSVLLVILMIAAAIPVFSFAADRRTVNHRGYHVNIPENTLSAFRASKAMGYSYVETDVSFTSDGVPVILHDTTINRIARNADGSTLSTTVNIADITYEQALQYSFDGGYAAYRGEKIPTLSEFLDLCIELNLHPYIELKNLGSFTQEQAQKIFDIVLQKGLIGKITWISFSLDYMKTMLNLDKTSRYGWLQGSISEDSVIALKEFVDAGVEVFADVEYSKITDDVVNWCNKYGTGLEAWTIDSASAVSALPAFVTAVTTNTILPGNAGSCGETSAQNSPSATCSCNCHKSGFAGFIWKIQRFFYKIFGTNKYCSCGAAHY